MNHSSPQEQTSIIRFRQDLRVHDNTALIQACNHSTSVLPIFVFEQHIIEHGPHHDARIGFLIDAVNELDQELRNRGSRLYVMYGDSTQILPQLISQYHIQNVYANRSYGRGAMSRDRQITRYCYDQGTTFTLCDDYLLVEPSSIDTRKVFGPYYKLRQQHTKHPCQSAPLLINTPHFELGGIDDVICHLNAGPNVYRPISRGRDALQHLNLQDYIQNHNRLDISSTTQLSPYLRFGLLSIRQVYQAFVNLGDITINQLITELAWRDFWHHIMHYFPETVDIEFQQNKRHIQWINDEAQFVARCKGRTGYPIIDAAMTQLTTEHRINGRARMLVASFLTKHLLIDRRRGEQYFAHYLIDYDRNINIGNRQRSASVGADPKPLRIFSPIIQAQKFDPEASYIKTHLPSLASFTASMLHDPLRYPLPHYPKPLVDHTLAYRRAKEAYRRSYDV